MNQEAWCCEFGLDCFLKNKQNSHYPLQMRNAPHTGGIPAVDHGLRAITGKPVAPSGDGTGHGYRGLTIVLKSDGSRRGRLVLRVISGVLVTILRHQVRPVFSTASHGIWFLRFVLRIGRLRGVFPVLGGWRRRTVHPSFQ